MNVHFNSHAHVERDARAFINPMFNGISTHTLTWSVTSQHGNAGGKPSYFNSHAHVERDATSE